MIINDNYYYIHIPRTGGRWVHSLFVNNNYKCNLFEHEKIYKDKLKKEIEIPHLEYPYYLKMTNNYFIQKFTIIRNPVDRFLSTVKALVLYQKADLNKDVFNIILSSKETLETFINNEIIKGKGNWFVPQINFISHDTKIWKFEDGFSKKFFDWLEYNFNFKFDNKNIKFTPKYYDEKIRIHIRPEQEDLIKEYYFKDCKILDYL